jgi:2-keto-4-pentenoate hydratase/2-oxohepta-3-ene-1,7-dioic acid hydratase in catechol pathway
MKLVRFKIFNEEKVGVLVGTNVIDLREARCLHWLSQGLSIEEAIQKGYKEIPDNMINFIEGGEITLSKAQEALDFVKKNPHLGKAKYLLKAVELLAPIPKPPMILNMGNAYRPFPLQGFTFKPVTGIIGPNEPIIIPKEISDFGAVWEIEIGIIIAKKGRRIPNNEKAYDYIYGYTIYNDITDYGRQIEGTFGSKIFDTFCPIGPCIVTKDEIEDPHNLIKRTWVNKQLASERSTKEMFHKIPEFVSIPSQTLTLLPGTIISTGASDSGRIKDGDMIEFEITKIGRIRNPVVTEK